MTDAPLLAAHDLVVSYAGQEAVHRISLEVHRGEVVGLIGPDGAGKTSTLRVLGGLQKANGGTATAFGDDCWRARRALHHRLGYLAQRFALYGDLTVDENIEFFAEVHGVEDGGRRREELLELTRLQPFRRRLAEKLSGGMKQKLGLACVLVHEPKLLILDEPTNGVDPVSRKEFWDILFEMKVEGMTILISTAYLDEGANCDRLALMHKSKIIDTAEPAIIQGDRPDLEEAIVQRIEGVDQELVNDHFGT